LLLAPMLAPAFAAMPRRWRLRRLDSGGAGRAADDGFARLLAGRFEVSRDGGR